MSNNNLRRDLDRLERKHNELVRDVIMLVIFTYLVAVGVLVLKKKVEDNEAIADFRNSIPHVPTLRLVGNPDVDFGSASVHTNLKDDRDRDDGVVG
jgi:hypothetical protein